MILGLEIGLLIAGILALVRGKMKFSKNKVAMGAPAYIAGVIMLLPMPLAFGIVVCYAVIQGARGGFIDENQLRTRAIIIEVAIVLLCFAIAMTIAGVYGKPPVEERKKRRRDDDDYEDDDRRPRRPRRAADLDEDDEEDRRPRKPRRSDDEDEEDRPRRPRRESSDAIRDERDRPKRPPRRDDDQERFKE